MADFKIAVQLTLEHEGGYVDNPADHGGPTNFGITQADMPGRNMKEITENDAIQFYTQHFWHALYGEIADQNVANKLFDMGVLFGIIEAITLLQHALGWYGDKATQRFDLGTLQTVNMRVNLLFTYRQHLLQHIDNICAASPDQRVFRQGWINRINS